MRRGLGLLLTISIAGSSHAQKAGEKFILKEDSTVYSLPGYDYKIYEQSKKKFDTYREAGVVDLIPRRLNWPKKGTEVEFLRKVAMPTPASPSEDYFYVRYPVYGADGSVTMMMEGWVAGRLFQPAPKSVERPKPARTIPAAPAPGPRVETAPLNKPPIPEGVPVPASPPAPEPVPAPAPVPTPAPAPAPAKPTVREPEPPPKPADCDLCTHYKLNAICQAGLLKNLEADLEKYNRQFKSPEELAAYFNSYRKKCRPEHHDRYMREYRHYIRLAAESFQVPEPLLACLLFKENQWGEAVSKSGAVGTAQLMPATINYVGSVLKVGNMPAGKAKKYQAIKEDYEKQVQEKLVGKGAGNVTAKSRRNYEHAKEKLHLRELAAGWNDYMGRLKKNETFKQVYGDSVPWVDRGPVAFNRESAETPPLAIGAAALYLREIVNDFKMEWEEDSVTGKGQLVHFLTALSGAYNAGPGNATRWIGNPAPSDAAQWVEKMGRNPETKIHMESIRRCMTKDDRRSPQVIGPGGRGLEQKQCNE